MLRRRMLIYLGLLLGAAYVALMIALLAQQAATPTDAKAIGYERQQVRSFALESALLAREYASGAAWDRFRKGAADMLLQQTTQLTMQLEGEQFTADVEAQGKRLARYSDQTSRLLRELGAPNVTRTRAERIARSLNAISRRAGRP